MGKLYWLLLVTFFVLAEAASAGTRIGLKGGIGVGGGDALADAESPIYSLGGEMVFGFGGLEVGGFFDRYLIDGSGSSADGGANFYGGVARFVTPGAGIFVDGMVGATQYRSGSSQTPNALGYGLGVGSLVGLVKGVGLMPRLSYTILPAKVTSSGSLPFTSSTSDEQGSIFEFSLMLRIGF